MCRGLRWKDSLFLKLLFLFPFLSLSTSWKLYIPKILKSLFFEWNKSYFHTESASCAVLNGSNVSVQGLSLIWENNLFYVWGKQVLKCSIGKGKLSLPAFGLVSLWIIEAQFQWNLDPLLREASTGCGFFQKLQPYIFWNVICFNRIQLCWLHSQF